MTIPTSKTNLDHEVLMARLVHLTHRLASESKNEQREAYREMLEMATEGHSEAMYAVARCLVKGTGVEPDPESGHCWLEQASVAVDPPRIALYSLGLLHIARTISNSNPSYGIDLLGRSAGMGYSEALTELLRLCTTPELDKKAQKITYRVLADQALSNDAGAERFTVFCESFYTPDLLDS